MGYKVCRRCAMDTTDPDIVFDGEGICNHCHEYQTRRTFELHYGAMGRLHLEAILDQMRLDGEGKDYDCIIGLSGGLDSSFVAYNLVQFGIKPLAVSLDNDWDMPVAKENVKNLVNKLNLDWEHVSVEPRQYKDLQMSFMKAGVINVEAPTDHAISSFLCQMANREGLRYIVHGGNIVTEAIMPKAWGYDAKDWKHIKAIHKKFGTESLKGFPHMNLFHWAYFTFYKGIKWFPLLNYVEYVPSKAKQVLAEAIGWKDYGGKHLESEWTAFFQRYILPKKFGIDKRKAHLSTLINSGFMIREDALEELKEDPNIFTVTDVERITRKFGMSLFDFQLYMAENPVPHSEYASNEHWFNRLKGFVAFAKRTATQIA